METCEYAIVPDLAELPRALLLQAEPDEATVDDYPAHSVAAVARADGAVVGAAVLLRDLDTMEVINLAVNSDMRGRGIGTSLLEAAISHAYDSNVRRLIIRTATTSTSQLLLYQRVGFRFSEINHGHFIEHYAEPMVENGVRCIDRLTLVFPIYRDYERRELVQAYWQDFTLRNPEHGDAGYLVRSLGNGPRAANALLNLAIEGRMTAATAPVQLIALRNEAMPHPGGLSVITYGDGRPGAVIETTEVAECAFSEVSDAHARRQGNANLSDWRAVYRQAFARDVRRDGGQFSDTMPVVCEQFRLLDVNRELTRL